MTKLEFISKSSDFAKVDGLLPKIAINCDKLKVWFNESSDLMTKCCFLMKKQLFFVKYDKYLFDCRVIEKNKCPLVILYY